MLFSYDEWPGGHNIATTPRMWRRILEQWGDTIGLNFDPSHLVLQMIDMRRFLKEFGAHVLHFQAKDLMIDRDGLYERGVLSMGMGWQIPRIPGLGEVDWSASSPSSTAPASRATASSSTRTGASRAPTRRSSRGSSSRATSCGRTASSDPRQEPHGTLHRRPDRAGHREDDRPLAAAARAGRRLRRGRLPAGREVRRRLGLRPARGRQAGDGDPGRHGRRRRDDDRLPARQPPDRDQGLRGAPGARRRRHRARHGDPDRGAEVRAAMPTSRRTSRRWSRSATRPAPSSR